MVSSKEKQRRLKATLKRRKFNRDIAFNNRLNIIKDKKASPIFTSKSSITTLENEYKREMYFSNGDNTLRKAKPLGVKIHTFEQYNSAVATAKALGYKDYWNIM